MFVLLHFVPSTLQQATPDRHLHQRLLDTHVQVWGSLLWGHCSFLLGPVVYKFLFVPSKNLFPQPCVCSGSSMVGLMATSSKRAYATLRSAAPKAFSPVAGHCLPIPALKGRSGSVSVGSPGVYMVCLSPLKDLWVVWGLILNMILPLLLSC